jgi:hypothetical protein
MTDIEKDLEDIKEELKKLSRDELYKIAVDCLRIILENDLLDLE